MSFWRRGIFETRDFGQDGGGFVLQGRFQRCVVCVWDFAGFVLEIEIAQVFVDGLFAFAKLAGAGFLRAEVEPSWQIENIEETSDSEHHADGETRHRSVSLPA